MGKRSLESQVLANTLSQSWREQALTRIVELEALTNWIRKTAGSTAEPFTAAAEHHLEMAKQAVGRVTPFKAFTGASVQRALGNIGAAEVALLRVAPSTYMLGNLPFMRAYVSEHLPASDVHRTALDRIAKDADGVEHLSYADRHCLITAFQDAGVEARREYMRVRSFRNFLLIITTLLVLFALGIAIFGAANPRKLTLCFAPEDRKVVCPTEENPLKGDIDKVTRDTASSWDIPLIESVGLIAALVAAATSVRRIRGTSTPYSLPLALTAVKLPAGALTAVVGLVLMRGRFVPGLSDLDSSAQIIAWAAVFGYSQQLLTHFIDERAQDVLKGVGSPDHDRNRS